MPKYNNSPEALNDNELYEDLFEDRGINQIIHYRTKLFGKDAIPKNIKFTNHVWSMGDRYFKLSYKYYQTYQYWWVIALFNNKPTEAHIEYGDTIKIPLEPTLIEKGI